ncbi:hypothetical protein SY83_14290 [Paenibacillus swuensis]|uniref:DUF4127 domain-containing protein n=1 Tax=Paenibacillus swuensis TaxID=1178515 RepID=A0A172TPJ0_9BACL|nr:hypothetical protein SY83_14290 [Paenibacillus swuensis]
MRIVYLPLDERPCNVDVVEAIARSSGEVELILPDRHLLGYKKRPADTERLWLWLLDSLPGADAMILSADMLIYGGLLPSRVHVLQPSVPALWEERLRALRSSYPQLPIYAFNLIMRTPRYSSSDEEPDYYEDWGRELFTRAYLHDKGERESLSETETEELNVLHSRLPAEHIQDYERRRAFNVDINLMMLELVKEGVITFLAIPQDDSAEFGYTARDQQQVVKLREALRLQRRVHMYPGADEAGATLLARAYNAVKGQKPRIYTFWSGTLGPQLIPLYEDRPFAESLKAHALAAGCQLTDRAEEADLVLAYNVPGRIMQESWEQDRKDLTYASFRHMLSFVERIRDFMEADKPVVIADSAFANGGDRELIQCLDEERMLDRLLSYKGWNTNCNTLGTTLSQGVLGLKGETAVIQENLIYHLLDDYIYQAEVRSAIVSTFLPAHELTYFDLKDCAEAVNEERDRLIRERYDALILHSFKHLSLTAVGSFAPWNRMFECGLTLQFRQTEEGQHAGGH